MVEEGRVLIRRPLSTLLYNPVHVRDNHDRLDIRTIGPSRDLIKGILPLRKPIDSGVLIKGLEKGVDLANLGVSNVLTIDLYGETYLILEVQARPGKPDVLKHCSGYLESGDNLFPERGADKELTEEILPMTPDERILRFIRYDQSKRPIPLHSPFKGHFDSYDFTLNLIGNVKFDFFGNKRKISINGGKIVRDPKITFHTPTSSAQLIYSNHIEVPQDISLVWALDSFYHTKERVIGDNLETILQKSGIVLAKLDKNRKLSGELYELGDSQLHLIDSDNLVLSEAFAENNGYLTTGSEIGFRDYVQKQ